MSRVSCVITEDENSTRHEYTPIKLNFTAQGTTKPDTLTAHFTMNNKVKENYEIAFIQDITSVEYLACIHNFQLSALDDRGYNLDGEVDGDTSIDESRFDKVSEGRFKGTYALNFTATGQTVTIPSATADTRIDLSGHFDIYIFFTPDQTDTALRSNPPILWSFFDGSNGLEIGLTDSTPITNTRGFVRFGDDNNIFSFSGSSQSIITGDPVLIRVHRGGDNIIRMEVNGVEDGTLTSTGSLQPTGVDLFFGNGSGNLKDYGGLIHQVRVYKGTVLTQIQADTIRQSRPALYTMKFAGLVWNLEDNQTHKIAQCDSYSKTLTKKDLSIDDFDNDDNRFGLQEQTSTLSFATVVSGGINFVDGASATFTGLTSGVTTATGTITSEAGVITAITIDNGSTGYIDGETLNVISGIGAGETVTATVTDETFQDILQNIVDETNSGFIVKAKDAFTSTTIATTTAALQGNLIVIGSFLDIISMLLLFSSTTFYVTPRKLLIIETNTGHETDYTFDQDSDTVPYDITENDDNDSIKVNEVVLTGDGLLTTYSPVALGGTTTTLRKYIQQLNHDTDLDTLGIVMRDSLSNVNTKYVVKINTPINWVRFNQIVTLNNTKKGISNDPFIITQIEQSYPRSHTTIAVNENDINFFDISNVKSSIQSGLLDSTQ